MALRSVGLTCYVRAGVFQRESCPSEAGCRSQPQAMALTPELDTGEEQSRISAESGEMLTTAALLLSENSALSTALMCHMMLQSEKCHCPSSNRRADCMCSMVSPSDLGVML